MNTTKKHLKSVEFAKFESDLFKSNEDIAPQSCEILQTFVFWGASSCRKKPVEGQWIFPFWSQSKVKKNVEGSIIPGTGVHFLSDLS